MVFPFAKGVGIALLLISMAPRDIAASPISLFDRTGDSFADGVKTGRSVDIGDQPRDVPVLRTVMPDAAPSPLGRPAGGAGAGASFPRSDISSATAPPGWSGEVPSEKPSSGTTLKDMLRSIITWHAAEQTQAAARRSAEGRFHPGSNGDDGELGVDLRNLILDSEIGGAMVRSIVDLKSSGKNGATFSVFGLGNFAVDFAPDLHAAILSELSSGMAFRMSLSGDRLGYDGYSGTTTTADTNPAAGPHENINLVRLIWKWILDFLYSPIGALLSMSAAITVVLWVCVKSVVFLQRRASRYER